MLSQPPNVIRQQRLGDLLYCSIVKKAQSEIEEKEMNKNKKGQRYSAIGGGR